MPEHTAAELIDRAIRASVARMAAARDAFREIWAAHIVAGHPWFLHYLSGTPLWEDVKAAARPASYADQDEALFPGFEPPPATPPAGEDLSAGQRHTLRVAADVKRGVHPLMRTPLHPGATTEAASTDPRHMPYTCGTCCYRDIGGGWPKCLIGPQSHGVGTDVRAWWPACPKFEPIDPKYAPPIPEENH